MAAQRRSIDRLTGAAFGPALLSVIALPLGFIWDEVAVVAGFYGLYFALPGVVAWCLDGVRGRLPRWAQRTLGLLILVVTILTIAFWLFWIGPLFSFAAPPAAVVLVVTFRLLRARSAHEPAAMQPGRATRTAPTTD